MSSSLSMQKQKLADLCRKKSDLTEEDIQILENLLDNLQYYSDLAGADIFIDVPTRDPKVAIVVAEAKPSTAISLYKGSVVGEDAYRYNEPAVFQTFQSGKRALNVQGVSQEGVPICQTVTPVKNAHDKIIAVLIMERDNSIQVKQERTMEFLSQTTQKLTDTLLNMAGVGEVLPTLINDALIIINPQGKICYANRVAHDLLLDLVDGINPVGMTVERLVTMVRELDLVFNSESAVDEVQIRRHTLLVRSLPFFEQAEVRGTVYLLRDITELRKTEQQLVTKSTVIREIHHRVKNNLQTIASLMRLQMRREQSQETREAFQASVNRIKCIALVHEIFSRETPEVIELRECIKRIGQILMESMILPEQKIEVEVRGEDIYLSSDQATPTAIVVNEVIQNSLKYAFPDNSMGKILVSVKSFGDRVQISIRDNGQGFPVGFDFDTGTNLGLQITRALVTESLGGRIFVYNKEGAVVQFEFPNWRNGDIVMAKCGCG